jgi:transglutaminase superfamily protein
VRARRWVLGAWETLRSLWPMIVIEVLLRTADLPATCRRLGVRCDLTSRTPPATELAMLPRRSRRVVLASHAVVSRWPGGDTCLRRCLLVGHRLRALDPVLRIGVRRTPEGTFSAHSWLEFDGAALDPTAARFAPLGAPGR